MSEDSRWWIVGPGGGGAQYIPTISPHDPRRVLVACDMTGAYITHDAGETWRMFNLRGRVTFFVFDPLVPDTIYAGCLGLWRSDDAGETWEIVLPDPETVTGVTLAGDHAEVTIDTKDGPFRDRVTALAVDLADGLRPTDSCRLYAAIRTGDTTVLCISSDRGASWQHLADLPDGGLKIYVDPRSPKENRTIYVVGNSSIWRRERGQETSGSTPAGVSRFVEVALGFPDGDAAPIAYAITETGAFISEDGGANWTVSHLPGEPSELNAIATCQDHPNIAYLSYRRLKISDETFFGVMKTTDRGQTWHLVWKENERVAENVKDAWVTDALGPHFGENPFSLGVAPHDPDLCYGTDWARTMRTTDGGRTWEAVYSRQLPDGSYTSTGLDVTTCYGVHFDPFDSRRLFLSYTDIGIFRSENDGVGWISSIKGVPKEWINTTYWVEFDPEVPGRMWAVMSGTHDLPRPKMWRARGVTHYKGGVCRSDDGGKTWRVQNVGMPQTAATHILLDPNSPASGRTLYVTGFGRGVYKSTDGGETWELKNAGLEGQEPFVWRLALDAQGTLYLIIARRSEDGRIGTEQDGALYRSTDGAQNWTKVPLPPDVNGPNGLAIDPEDAQRLYLAAWSRPVDGKPVGGGIYLSTDGGQSWSNVLDRDQHVYDVTIDPNNPDTLYACGFSSSAWKSTDRGTTWRRLPGYNFKWGQRVVPDRNDPASIYIATFGGSVWHRPADGLPGAIEDIVTPPLRYPEK